MTDMPWLALALGAGIGLVVSGLFFAGLAWTLRRALRSAHPAPLLIGSFLLRAALLIGVAVWLLQLGDALWAQAGYWLAFFVARTLAVRRAKRGAAPTPLDPLQEG